MSPVLVELGPLTIRWYGLMYVVAIVVGIWLTYREVKRKGIVGKRKNEVLNLDDVLDFVLLAVPLGIVCARLYYVLFQWDYYGRNLLDILKIWQGGLAIHGGIIGGALALFIFVRWWKKVGFWQFADAVVPSLVLGQVFGRFGNFMNGDAYGTPTDLPWGIRFPTGTPAGNAYPDRDLVGQSQPLHPAMLYELGGNALIFALLWGLRKRGYRDGFLTCLYFVLYSALRFVVEAFRGDSLWLVDGRWKAAQVISVVLFVVFTGLMFQWKLWTKRDEPAQAAR